MKYDLEMCKECKHRSFCRKRKVHCEEYSILIKALEAKGK
ncbi:hypothetical protein B0H39_000408 [Clostridium beijerinckii]|jgi:hypothetical protein|uniref:Uncharacterized protein n=1 Tax=Clostridium beijerinckii TaxID=1520 RepID=A0AAE5H8L1_CLOBE|nr:hypothetical protein [Clostridium beijerinckii]NSB16480.1 hypothetical protein [Clostridium beijerinckii]OOM25685.1 hypothetical protein CLOBE_34800 [Clostridium beijerinckii]